jgi:hypothetical protein
VLNRHILNHLIDAFRKFAPWAVLIVLILFSAFLFYRAVMAFGPYIYIKQWVVVRLGLDYYLAEFIAITLSSIASALLPTLAWFFLLGRYRFIGALIFIGISGCVAGLVYTVGQEVYFDRQTGQPLRYYADTPEGRQFSFTPGFHPKYPIEYRPYTKEVAEELARQQALREQELREAEERRKKETEARRRLAQEGVRGRAISPDSARLPSLIGVSLELLSNPEGAEVFLDWVLKGQTPLWLEGINIAGFLVVAKDGYKAQFHQVNYAENIDLTVMLPAEEALPRSRMLLLASNDALGEAFSLLSTRLMEEGFSFPSAEEAKQFQRSLSQAGGLSHPALRAWARAKFNTELLVTARLRQSTREVSKQNFGYPGIREALHGVEQAEIHIALEVQDLHSSDYLTVVTGRGEAFALDRGQSLQKALREAVTEAAKKLRLWAQS